MRVHRTDCLVIGAGLAGSVYALQAAKHGLSCELLSLADPLQANSDWAQGGIIYDTSPDPAALTRDILEAGDQMSNPAAVEQLVREGPAIVKRVLIDELGVKFDRDPAGRLDFALEGGHGERRIIHSRDATGHAILSTVARRVDVTPAITRRAGWVAIDLLTLSHNTSETADKYHPLTCFGAYVLDTQTGEVSAIVAKKTVLARGGLGQIFLHTTNQPGSVGHGVAMAYRVGARLIDLEYVQFHPTVFAKKNAPPFLVSEALRGEGAVLVNSKGARFMDAVHPRGSLAPRDVVTRTIRHEMAMSGEPCVFLDLSAMPPGFASERFPNIRERCLAQGVDIEREPIPVIPAAHFACGGVHTDLNGRTNILNLAAIGETACTGLHGANRLASTSLLECLTGATFTAEADARDISRGEFHLPDPNPWESPTRRADPVLIGQDMLQIQHTMWNYAGVVRSPRRLTRARRILLELREEIQSFYRGCAPTRELVELRNAVQTALLVVHAAALNPVSKGCHYVADDD
jgi:L-aspartate oxidase